MIARGHECLGIRKRHKVLSTRFTIESSRLHTDRWDQGHDVGRLETECRPPRYKYANGTGDQPLEVESYSIEVI